MKGISGRIMLVGLVAGAALAGTFAPIPGQASTYFEEQIKCPVGGKRFKYMALGSISTWGALPDGMPLGSGRFPTEMPRCPDNGLVLYRKFTAAEVKTLTGYVASPEFAALRSTGETPYYLAYRIATMLGDKAPQWLLLNATWEAKNADPAGPLVRRYNEEFVAFAAGVPSDPTDLESVALHARRVNALRELGRFEEAEMARAAIAIAPDAGGADDDAKVNREGWTKFITMLAGPIARRDATRAPIDLLSGRETVFRCLGAELATRYGHPAPEPLTAFEQDYCRRPELAGALAEQRKSMEELPE